VLGCINQLYPFGKASVSNELAENVNLAFCQGYTPRLLIESEVAMGRHS
jgi:hypothetical protein